MMAALTPLAVTVAMATPSTVMPMPATKKNVKPDVDASGGKKAVERPACVAYASQNCRAEIVDHKERHSEKEYAQINGGHFEDVVRRTEHFEHRTCRKLSYNK